MPTESPLTQRAAGLRTHTTLAVGEHCKQSTPVERTQASSGRQALETLSLPARQLPRAITLDPEETSYLLAELMTARKPVVALNPGKVHSPAATGRQQSPVRNLCHTPVADSKMNSPGRLYGSTRLPLSGFTYY